MRNKYHSRKTVVDGITEVIKSMEACAEQFSGCEVCAFGPIDIYNQSCISRMMQAAAEYLREKFPEPGN